MKPNRIPAQLSIRFTEDRIREAARRLAYEKAKSELATVEGICEMVDDFEQVAIERGLPDGAYEIFEEEHTHIGRALVDLYQWLDRLSPIPA